VIRDLLIFGLLFLFTKKLIGNSLKQDKTKSYAETAKNKSLAPGFLIVFALGFTLMSFDQIMSLDPHWFSTIFGVYCFAGLFYSTLALTMLYTLKLKRGGQLNGIVNDNHLHDLGKYMFAFTIFWAYIGFSQFMLIWYANLPEETRFYIARFHGGWQALSWFLLVKFALPFLVLLPRGAKRDPMRLRFVGWFMVIAQWVDMLWLVQPSFFPEGPMVGPFEIGVTLGFAGLFMAAVNRFLGKNPVVAVGDPYLSESVNHHTVA
jgi:hypothetical protein